MKAIRKSDGQVVEVEKTFDSIWHDVSTDGIDEKNYYESDLDFNLPAERDTDLTISLAKLREVLNEELKHKILPSKIDEIINRIKQEMK